MASSNTWPRWKKKGAVRNCDSDLWAFDKQPAASGRNPNRGVDVYSFARRLSNPSLRIYDSRFRLTNGRPKGSGIRYVQDQGGTARALRTGPGIVVNRCDINSVHFLTFCLAASVPGCENPVTWRT